jgi:hypothetical protein
MADKPFAWLITCLIWAGPAFGFSIAPKVNCPTQFRAIASEVKDAEGSESSLSKQLIKFSIEESLKGSLALNEIVQVELLKFGPLIVEAGREYLVQLNQGKLCWLEAIE